MNKDISEERRQEIMRKREREKNLHELCNKDVWEYDIDYMAFTDGECIEEKEEEIMELLNKRGDDGWELVQMDNVLCHERVDGNLIFKRKTTKVRKDKKKPVESEG